MSTPLLLLALALALAALLTPAANGVDRSKFRTCEQTAFCRRGRGRSDSGPWTLLADSIAFDAAAAALSGDVRSGAFPEQPPLKLRVQALVNEVVRVTIDESPSERPPRYRVADVLQQEGVAPLGGAAVNLAEAQQRGVVTMTLSSARTVRIFFDPFVVELLVDGVVAMSANSRGFMNFEPRRERNPRPEDVAANVTGTAAFPFDEEDMWQQTFGGHTDTIRSGPTMMSMDVTMPGVQHVFGIPEHAAQFSLPTTRGGAAAFEQPFRLFNLDVFEYELDSPMALYGSIPFVVGPQPTRTSAVLWLNAAETFVDIEDDTNGDKAMQWISESGVIDMFMFVTPEPKALYAQCAQLTGFPALPPLFAIAHHQCRWNYRNEADVSAVHRGFDDHDMPVDVIWLDIEHTNDKRYFTWHPEDFANPLQMQSDLAKKGRKLVTIVDPHIKRADDYVVHQLATQHDHYVKNADGSVFIGHCWPGQSSYIDFVSPEARAFWSARFSFDQYVGSSPTLFTWIDMNEPSVFSGPEVTMPKDCLHANGAIEHRDVHNQYGFYDQMATFGGQLQRGGDSSSDQRRRPFVLSRSFFAGSQRFGAVWTGDNLAHWSHLQAAAPMLLSMSAAGLPFVGADIGGFFGNPDPELLVRWYQAAAFQPFFRAHAHIDTERREPWLFGAANTARIRAALRRRYALLPYLYTAIYESATTGVPVLRALWMEFPADTALYAEQSAFMLGGALLVCPVTAAGVTDVMVRLPGAQPWYDQQRGGVALLPAQTVSLASPLDAGIPVLQRGGTIVAMQMRARRSTASMRADPYTLVVALSDTGDAEGDLFVDDGETFAYEDGAFMLRRFAMANGVLRGFAAAAPSSSSSRTFVAPNAIERIVVMGAPRAVQRVTTGDGRVIEHFATETPAMITLRRPPVGIADDFTITFTFAAE